jgi:D-amino-acid dehydrogenase
MKALVLGAGVVGTSTAYYLAKNGFEVDLVDRQPGAALETSFGNGGVLHTSECEPWSRPGMPANILRWLGKDSAPLLLRYSAIPHMWRWGLGFVRACTPERYRRSTMSNLRLSFYTLRCVQEIRAELKVDYDLRTRGSMKIYTRPESLEKNRIECEAMRPYGMTFEVADPKRCVELEPALAPIQSTLAGGLWFPPDETGDCHKFTTALRQHCESLGVRTHFETTVRGLERSGDRIAAVQTNKGSMTADAIVVAMGSFSAPLLRGVGVSVQIYPVKGLSVTVPAGNWDAGPQMPIIDDTRLFGLIRLGDRYRCSGSAEITGYDTRPDPARVQAIVDNVISVFPEFRHCYDPATAKPWAGLRPMTPSGNPYLGSTGLRNLWINAGHGHLGWTMSCGSGRAVADLLAGRKPEIDLTGFTINTRI